jgi:hypothetical protein
MVVVLFFVSIITFLLAFAVPGDPAKSIAGTHATPEVLQRIRTELGLDQPIYVQYGQYLWALVRHASMGYSYETQLPVTTAILQRFPAIVMVAFFGILPGLAVGLGGAVRGPPRDRQRLRRRPRLHVARPAREVQVSGRAAAGPPVRPTPGGACDSLGDRFGTVRSSS